MNADLLNLALLTIKQLKKNKIQLIYMSQVQNLGYGIDEMVHA